MTVFTQLTLLTGSFAPFGYRKSEESIYKIEVDEEAAAIVRRIFDLLIGGEKIALIAVVFVMIFTVCFIAVSIEQKAGYYECQKCHDRHVPTYWQTNLAMHVGRTRYMKCPLCGKWS